MIRLTLAAALLLSTAFVSACVTKPTTKASPEHLGALLDSGIKPEDKAKAEERLAKTLDGKALAGLATSYEEDLANGPQSVSLALLFSNALERNIDIGRAAQRINQAEAERMNAVYGYLPQVSFTGSYNELQQNVVQTDNAVFQLGKAQYPVTNLAVELKQPIFDMSRIYGIQLKKTARSVAEVEYVGAVQSVMYDVFDTYVSAVQSKTRSRDLRQRMSLVSAQISAGATLADTGLSTESETLSYRAEQSSLGAEEAIEASKYQAALAKLSLLTGTAIKDVEAVRMPAGLQGAERRMTAAQAIAAAEENNPALLGAAIAVVEGELGRKQALAADFIPVLEAFARYEDETREGSRFGGGSQTQDTTIGVRLTIPIFNARGQGYATSERIVDLRQDALAYFNTKRQLQTEITGTLARMAQISRAIGQSSQALSALNANVRAEKAKVISGESVDVAVLSRELSAGELSEQVNYQRMEYLRAWGRLQYLTGAKFANLGF